MPDVSHWFVLEVKYTDKGLEDTTIKGCKVKVTNAHLFYKQKCLIYVVSFGRTFTCNSILSLQISGLLDVMPRDWSVSQGE